MMTEDEFNQAIEDAVAEGYDPKYAMLKWKHTGLKKNGKECGHVFLKRYTYVQRGSGCPECNMGKNQKIAHRIAEYLFGKKFDIEKSLVEIFPKLRKIFHANVHVDSFCELDLKDKKGNKIKLAIERQGQQHEDSEAGWNSYLHIKLQNLGKKYEDLTELDLK